MNRGVGQTPRLPALDPDLLGQAMLSFAEMLGRLAARDAEAYSQARLEKFATTLIPPIIVEPAPADH